MAEEQMTQQQLLQESLGGLDPLSAPIPGESLTADPETRAPFEKPPEHTELQPAIEELFMRLTEGESIDDTLDLMRQGAPIESVAQVVLFEGFRQGKFNPDMMLLLVEPTIYILAFLANYAGIDAVLYPEEDFDNDEEGEMEFLKGAEGLSGIPASELPQQITVGESVLSRPESVSPDLLQTIQGGGEEEAPSEEELV